MSDTQHGPGWWLASDGKWYPPETAPEMPATAPEPEPERLTPDPGTYVAPGTAPTGETPNFNLPGGGTWAAPQQIVVANASKSPGLAVGALALGVGSFFFALIPIAGFLSVPFAICAIALGIAGVSRAAKGYEGKGLSIAGIATGAAALFVSAVYLFIFVVAAGEAADDINSDPSDGFCNVDRFLEDPDC